MKKVYTLLFMAVFLVSFASANQADVFCGNKWLCNQALTFECQNFYNDTTYYTVSNWMYSEKDGFYLNEQNARYRYFKTSVQQSTDNSENIAWTSNPKIKSVLVKTNNETKTLEGGSEGFIIESNVNEVIFCGQRTLRGTSNSGTGSGNGVPEFPAYSAIAAVLAVTLGIVFLRRN